MTPQEQDMIQGLINRVQQTQLPDKDADAENLIQGSLGRNPDALYILAQTILVQKYALEQAQKQLADLKAQLDQTHQQQGQPRHATSFLGSLLGLGDSPPPPPLPPSSGQRNPGSGPQYAPVQNNPSQPGYAQGAPQYAPSAAAPAGGGFLRSAMQTATGVAAGALAFQGIESLMHGFGGGGGGFGGQQGFGGFGGGGSPREEVINNYYGDSGRDSGDNGGLSNDIEDRRSDGGDQFAGDSNNVSDDTGNDFAANDDSSGGDSLFDSGSDSSFDSGGDSGGGDDSSFS